MGRIMRRASVASAIALFVAMLALYVALAMAARDAGAQPTLQGAWQAIHRVDGLVGQAVALEVALGLATCACLLVAVLTSEDVDVRDLWPLFIVACAFMTTVICVSVSTSTASVTRRVEALSYDVASVERVDCEDVFRWMVTYHVDDGTDGGRDVTMSADDLGYDYVSADLETTAPHECVVLGGKSLTVPTSMYTSMY